VTLLLVTHDAEAAAFADVVVQLRDGQIVQTPEFSRTSEVEKEIKP
jgi:ABC-type lipoprotein export system ATPase subunit